MVLWTPAEIGTALWLDAADATTITTVADVVSEWRDKSGSMRHGAQSNSSYRPAIATAELNGLDGVRGDGVNDYLELSAGGIAKNVSGMTIFAVAKNTGGDTYRSVFIARTPLTPTRAGMFLRSGTLEVGGRRLDADGFQTVSISQSGTSLCTAQFDYANATLGVGIDGSALTYRVGGFQTPGNTSNTTSSFVGIFADTSASRLNGDIYELIVLQSVPSTADRQIIEGYLAWKWGLQINLATGHPYELAAPTIPDPPSGSITIKLGDTTITAIYSGDIEVTDVYVGDVKIG